MDIIDELRAIENIYEVEIDGVWYVDMSDLSDEDKEKVEKLTDNTTYSDEYYICDCCGKSLDKFPWKTKYGLCDECNDFHYKKDKVIWRNNIIKIKEEKLNRICWR